MKLHLYKFTFSFLMAALVLSACTKEYEPIEVTNTKDIEEYLSSNNLTGFKDTLNMYYKVTKPGTGAPIDYTKETPTVFTVRSLDGRFVAADTMAGFNRFANRFGYITLSGMKNDGSFREIIKNALRNTDGEIRIIIPSRLAYGQTGYSYFDGYTKLTLPGNSSLDVTVKVIGDLAKYEDEVIKKYIRDNNLGSFSTTASGLYYKITEEGTGSPITVDSTITAAYTGKLLNGTAFETVTTDNAVSFVVGDLAKGWQEGVPMIKEGGSIRLIMPSRLGYGNAGSKNVYTGAYTIPPFSPLDFEVKVTAVAE